MTARPLLAVGLAAVVIAGAVAAAVQRLGAAPAGAVTTAEECRFVAEIDAARWREVAGLPQVAGRGLHFVSGRLAGAPRPWAPQADDGRSARLRLWATRLRNAGSGGALDCSAAFKAAGLNVDPGFAARPRPPGAYVDVTRYSRVRFASGGAWALADRRVCEPRDRATDARTSTALYARRSGHWTTVADDSAAEPAIMALHPWPERCEGGARP